MLVRVSFLQGVRISLGQARLESSCSSCPKARSRKTSPRLVCGKASSRLCLTRFSLVKMTRPQVCLKQIHELLAGKSLLGPQGPRRGVFHMSEVPLYWNIPARGQSWCRSQAARLQKPGPTSASCLLVKKGEGRTIRGTTEATSTSTGVPHL